MYVFVRPYAPNSPQWRTEGLQQSHDITNMRDSLFGEHSPIAIPPSTEYPTIGWFSKRTSSAICTQHPRQKIRIENNLFNRGIKCSLSIYTLYTKIKRNMFWYISITNTIQQGVRMSNWHLQREVDRSAYIINK